MNLENARNLKSQFLTTGIAAISEIARSTGGASVLSRSLGRDCSPLSLTPMIGVGIAPRSNGRGYALAIRLADSALRDIKPIQEVTEEARGEVDIRIVGRIYALNVPWYQGRVRPIQGGISIGHFNVTAGTLGAIVRMRGGDGSNLRILGNNHVLADVNRGLRGDAILQPGKYDGGREQDGLIGHLDAWNDISFVGPNEIDAAIATIAEETTALPGLLEGIGQIGGVAADERIFEERLDVLKLGRTTGLRRGIVTAAEMSGISVDFGVGQTAVFDNQIEIQSSTNEPFSRGGDSGSLLLTEDREVVGLVFAGTDLGGAGGLGLTYANPIAKVLERLQIEIVAA